MLFRSNEWHPDRGATRSRTRSFLGDLANRAIKASERSRASSALLVELLDGDGANPPDTTQHAGVAHLGELTSRHQPWAAARRPAPRYCRPQAPTRMEDRRAGGHGHGHSRGRVPLHRRQAGESNHSAPGVPRRGRRFDRRHGPAAARGASRYRISEEICLASICLPTSTTLSRREGRLSSPPPLIPKKMQGACMKPSGPMDPFGTLREAQQDRFSGLCPGQLSTRTRPRRTAAQFRHRLSLHEAPATSLVPLGQQEQ